MGRERQKKKNRSSVRNATLTRNGRTKNGRKKVNFLGNPIITENWDHKLTVIQNYQRLGLSSRLNGPTGGSEKKPIPDEPKENQAITKNPFTIPKSRVTTKLVPGEIKVERDPQTGRILRIVHSDGDSDDGSARRTRLNPLNDLLQDLSDEEDSTAKGNRPSDVVLKLQEQADQEAAVLATKRRPRQQSKREEEWISILAEKYGDNTRAMARDVKLNPMQQSEGDLARKLKKWKATRQIQA